MFLLCSLWGAKMRELPIMEPLALAGIALPPGLRVISAAAAGFPSPAQDWADDAIDIIELLRLDRPASFVFRISGESMVGAGIHDDDLVVVDRDVKPKDGQVVIAVVEGGFVCREIRWRDGVPVLRACNRQMRYPLTVADQSVEIWGVVRTVVRAMGR